MTDTERLNLIEHYKWNIEFKQDGLVYITSHAALFEVYAKGFRSAIELALTAQREWALG